MLTEALPGYPLLLSLKKASREEGKVVSETAVDERFWQSADELTSLREPISSLLHLVDGTVPMCGQSVLENDPDRQWRRQFSSLLEKKKIQLRSCINERWKMMHTQLHSRGFVLEHKYRLFLQHENEEVMSDSHALVECIFNEDVQSQIKLT